MNLVKTLLLAAAGSMIAGAASAADALPPILSPITAAPTPGCDVAGYVDAFAGYGWWNEWQTDLPEYEWVWRELGFGGAGRAAIQCAPRFSIQLDAWAEHWSGVGQEIDYGVPIGSPVYFSSTWLGVAAHLTVHFGGFAAGLLLSVGSVADWGTFGTVAAEAALNTEKIRLQGQAGFTMALFGDAALINARDYYAQLVAAFYPRPNMSFAATFGADFYQDDDPWVGFAFNWGARVELQPVQRHVAFYLAYQGWFWRDGPGNDPDLYTGIEHVGALGIRFLIGAPTLREMDEQVGLADYNAIYGPTFRR
jgi:hypothetical protein